MRFRLLGHDLISGQISTFLSAIQMQQGQLQAIQMLPLPEGEGWGGGEILRFGGL